MYILFNSCIPFIATAGGFPKFHFYAIPLLILLGFGIGRFVIRRRAKV
jgi:hypothetical protein